MRYFFPLLFLLLLPFATAHAVPNAYSPDAYVTLDASPRAVNITFTERPEPKASSLTVRDPDGRAVSGETTVISPYVLGTSVSGTGNGTYLVSWSVISADDGHFSEGSYIFHVGQKTAEFASHDHDGHAASVWEAIPLALELLGQALVMGILLFWTASSTLRRRLGLISAALIIAGALSYVVFQSMEAAGSLELSFVSAVALFSSTTAGTFALIRAGLGVALGVSFWRSRAVIPAILLGLMILARARMSHAAASEFQPALSILINAAHLAFKELWIGGIIVLFILFSVTHLHDLARKFSRAAAIALAGGGVTGLYIIWLHLKGPANLASPWGTLFIILSALAAALLALRLYNHRRPARTALGAEALVATAVLFVSSMLIITTPPLDTPRWEAESQGVRIALADHADHYLITFDETEGKLLILKDILIVLSHPETGPIEAHTVFSANGEVLPKYYFSVPGTWKVDITAQRLNAYDATASFEIQHPSPDVGRRFGAFELLLLLSGAVLLAGAFFLHKRA